MGLALTLVTDEQTPAPAPAPAPAVETAPAPAVETVLARRDLAEEQELVSTINRACYMHGACTRGLPVYDEYVDEMFGSWSMVLDNAAGELALYLEHTAFRSNRDKAARRTLLAVLDKAVRKLNKHGID